MAVIRETIVESHQALACFARSRPSSDKANSDLMPVLWLAGSSPPRHVWPCVWATSAFWTRVQCVLIQKPVWWSACWQEYFTMRDSVHRDPEYREKTIMVPKRFQQVPYFHSSVPWLCQYDTIPLWIGLSCFVTVHECETHLKFLFYISLINNILPPHT